MSIAYIHQRTPRAAASTFPRSLARRSPSLAISPQLYPVPTIARCVCGGNCLQCEERGKKKRLSLQAKLKVNEPGDIYEREADRIADQVMATSALVAVSDVSFHTQRFSGRSIRQSNAAPAGVDQVLTSPGKPLDSTLRQDMEQRFGHDFSQVRVHSDVAVGQSAREVNARAYTVGSDIVFDHGEFAPDTSLGRKLLAHELTHVVQQERGVAQSSPGTIQRQPKTETPEFPDFPQLALKLEDDIGQNLFDYGHHFYRLATLYPDRPELLQEAFGRYALGANVLESGFRFLGLDKTAASRLAIGSGVLFKGLNFVKTGEVVLDFQFDIGQGLKLETNLKLGVNPDDYSQVQKAEAGVGLVGHF
jgi:hypothetical protein